MHLKLHIVFIKFNLLSEELLKFQIDTYCLEVIFEPLLSEHLVALKPSRFVPHLCKFDHCFQVFLKIVINQLFIFLKGVTLELIYVDGTHGL